MDAKRRIAVSFTLDTTGADLFERLTSAGRGQSLAVLVDNDAYFVATVQAAISQRVQLTGDFSTYEVDRLVSVLKASSLPIEVKGEPISVQEVPSHTPPGALWITIGLGMLALVGTGLASGAAWRGRRGWYLVGGLLASIPLGAMWWALSWDNPFPQAAAIWREVQIVTPISLIVVALVWGATHFRWSRIVTPDGD